MPNTHIFWTLWCLKWVMWKVIQHRFHMYLTKNNGDENYTIRLLSTSTLLLSVDVSLDIYDKNTFISTLYFSCYVEINSHLKHFSEWNRNGLGLFGSYEKCIDLKLFSFQFIVITTLKASLNVFMLKCESVLRFYGVITQSHYA